MDARQQKYQTHLDPECGNEDSYQRQDRVDGSLGIASYGILIMEVYV